MDINTALNLIGIYVLKLIFLNSSLAAYSYAYHVCKNHVSIETQKQFQAVLRAPSKWLFVGQKPFAERILIGSSYYYKNLEEYFQKVTLLDIQLPRIILAVLSMLIISVDFIGIYLVPEKHLIIQFVVHIVVELSTWFSCFRFGDKLALANQAT